MMCMSCHDGITSIAANYNNDSLKPTLMNAPGSGNPVVAVDPMLGTPPGAIYNAYAGGITGWGPNIGDATPTINPKVINLSNDHPISFEWPNGMTTELQLPTDPRLRLFGTSKKRVECATCHNVHDPAIPPFLAMDNSYSLMCRQCHIK